MSDFPIETPKNERLSISHFSQTWQGVNTPEARKAAFAISRQISDRIRTDPIINLSQKPFTKESVDSCIQAIIDMYNLPKMFVRMLTNKYWEDLKKRKVVASES